MKDKDKLKKLVQIIGELLKVDGNEWLMNEILKVIGESTPIEEMANYPLIDEIYEHCIKKIITKQASDFYSQLSINDNGLIDSLIYDYKEMEYNRRRDRFYEFSFCLNQQIEGLTNFLFEKKYKQQWNKLSQETKDKVVENYFQGEKQIKNTLQDVIFRKEKENKNSWSDLSKFKLVYYLMNRSDNEKLPFDFKRMRDIRQEISIARNESHRGSGKYEWQKEILASIKGNESKYYFKFYGFLQAYINQIESSYSLIRNRGNEKKMKSSKPKTQKNTIGANSSSLAKLSQELKGNE